MTEDEVRQVAALVSSERLAAFVAITGTERDALELHQQTMDVGAALVPVTGMIEIALRNAVCEQLRQTFDKPDWLTHPPAPFVWRGEESDNIRRCTGFAQRAAYSKNSQAEKKALDAIAFPGGVPKATSHEARSKARQRAISITTGQLIAQLTLFFWKRLFSSDYESALWRRSLKRLFPDKTLTRAQVAESLEVIYQARNRIAHHEPLYGERLRRTLEAIDFITETFATKTPGPDAILARMCRPARHRLQVEADKLAMLLAQFIVPSSPDVEHPTPTDQA